MDKSYITIEKADGTTENMVVVTQFKLIDSCKDCLIYKSEKDNEYYAAAYNEIADEVDLDVNFTDREKEQIQKIFDTLYEGEEL